MRVQPVVAARRSVLVARREVRTQARVHRRPRQRVLLHTHVSVCMKHPGELREVPREKLERRASAIGTRLHTRASWEVPPFLRSQDWAEHRVQRHVRHVVHVPACVRETPDARRRVAVGKGDGLYL